MFNVNAEIPLHEGHAVLKNDHSENRQRQKTSKMVPRDRTDTGHTFSYYSREFGI